MTTTESSWSEVTKWRKECYKRFGSLLQIQIINSWVNELDKHLTSTSQLLDVGAGVDKPHKIYIQEPTQTYHTLDIDPMGDFNFKTFDEIPNDQKYDIMLATQVFEHITIPESFELLSKAYQHTKRNGIFIATVPNVAHPVRYWADVTHVTHWSYNDFYGLFRQVGYGVSLVARTNKKPKPRNPLRRLIVKIVAEEFRMDWCDTIVIVGIKLDKHQ